MNMPIQVKDQQKSASSISQEATMSGSKRARKKIKGDMQKEKTFMFAPEIPQEPPFTIRYSENPIPVSEFIDDHNVEF